MDSERIERRWGLLTSRLGRRYANCRLSNYECDGGPQGAAVASVRDYLENLQGNIRSGVNVVFFGPPGTGKDHLMTAMLRAAVTAGLDVNWQDGADLFGGFRDAMRGTETEAVMMSRFTTPSVLAISDPVPPFGGLSEYQASMFFRLIDRRYRDMLPTWVTINAEDRSEMEQRIGANIVDRLGHDALAIPCNWKSRRKA